MNTIENLRRAIVNLDATEEEKDALTEILHVEGFGGREDNAGNVAMARPIAEERLAWLRDQRREGRAVNVCDRH